MSLPPSCGLVLSAIVARSSACRGWDPIQDGLGVGWGGVLARQAHTGHLFFYHSPPMPVFAPTSPNNLEYLLAVSKNLAHPLHPVYDDGKGGGWKWWE